MYFRPRKKIRLEGHDYASPGAYFITLCCQGRLRRFGRVANGQMLLNDLGRLAARGLAELQAHYPGAAAPVFIVMPDHVHFILTLAPRTGREGEVGRRGPPLRGPRPAAMPRPLTVGAVVRVYKTMVGHWCLDLCKSRGVTMGKLWQPGFYDVIIRTQASYDRICKYIRENPANASGRGPARGLQ